MLKIHTVILMFLASMGFAHAAPVQPLDQDARAALNALYASSPAAKALGDKAKGVLVFPHVHKAAIVLGGQSGEGAMFANGEIVGHYSVSGPLVGPEVGAQTFAYAMFFMSDSALQDLRSSNGFEIGADPNVVVVDSGAAKEISTTTTRADVYAYVFNQKGLMGGVALQGLTIVSLDR